MAFADDGHRSIRFWIDRLQVGDMVGHRSRYDRYPCYQAAASSAKSPILKGAD
ncbi:MAG: hypothetical protein OSB00_10125 [Sphingomonas bacterium]|nr:hypothetical protein [Sphingomonas bacterium]